jgi:cyclic-di-GMP-binding biofilm dispersal mediator protein
MTDTNHTTSPASTGADNASLDGASVLVAGATGGLGSAIAANLAARGATLTLVSRQADRLANLDVAGHRVALDLRDPSNCQAAVAAAAEHGGGLDVVINAVGVVAFGPVEDLSVDAMEELFLTNTFVPIYLAKAALPVLNPGGTIVTLSGVIAEQNLPGMAAYGASKAAVRSFDEALAREARRKKIRILDARPPHTETGLADRPIEGSAPKMPTGLSPESVAATIANAVADTKVNDLPSGSFVE